MTDNERALELCKQIIDDQKRNMGSCEVGQNTMEAIMEALSKVEVDGWQPIETAPLNEVVEVGNDFCHAETTLAWSRQYKATGEIRWFESTWLYPNTQDEENTIQNDHRKPTHWKPKSNPPKDKHNE